jgi:hypothetical protein
MAGFDAQFTCRLNVCEASPSVEVALDFSQ